MSSGSKDVFLEESSTVESIVNIIKENKFISIRKKDRDTPIYINVDTINSVQQVDSKVIGENESLINQRVYVLHNGGL
jgi:hypothetical protein